MSDAEILRILPNICEQQNYLERWLKDHGYIDWETRARLLRQCTTIAELAALCPAFVESFHG